MENGGSRYDRGDGKVDMIYVISVVENSRERKGQEEARVLLCHMEGEKKKKSAGV